MKPTTKADYLKVVSFVSNKYYETICNWTIPNKEVQMLYSKMIQSWLSVNGDSDSWYRKFLEGFLSDDIGTFQDNFGQALSKIVSVHDTARNSENFYHGFILGLTASLRPQEYEVILIKKVALDVMT